MAGWRILFKEFLVGYFFFISYYAKSPCYLLLRVHTAIGIIKPNQPIEVTIHHEEFHTQEEFLDGTKLVVRRYESVAKWCC